MKILNFQFTHNGEFPQVTQKDNNMDFRIALEWDERCGISLNTISFLSEGIENAFVKKEYGISVSQIWIVISCRDRIFKQRKRYKRDITRIEYDILLNYNLIANADIESKKKIINREVVALTEQTFSTYKFESFDKSSFLIDFKEFVESIEW